jgi:hypothetical protein
MVVAACLAAHVMIFSRPFFNADEAIYSAVAARLNDGGILYRDAVDHKPPLIYWTYALVFRGFGRYAMHAVHALCIGYILVAALALYRLGRRLYGVEAGFAAALLYGVYSACSLPKWFLAANAEHFSIAPMTLGVLLAVEAADERRRWRHLVAGLLFGVAGLYKVQAAFAGGAAIAYAVIRRDRRPAGPIVMVLGGLVPVALTCAWFRRAGAWSDFLFWSWTYPRSYAAQPVWSESLRSFGSELGFWFAVVLPLASIGMVAELARLVRSREPARWLIVPWVLVALIQISLGGRFFMHYFLYLLVPACLAAANPIARLWGAGRARAALVVLLALPALGCIALAPFNDWYLGTTVTSAKLDRVSRWLRTETAPDERLFVWGNSPELYVLGDRPIGSRFVFTNYQVGKIWGTPSNQPNAPDELTRPNVVERAWSLLLADLVAAPPPIVVDAAAGGLAGFARHPLTREGRLRPFLAGYDRVAVIDGVVIYRRR